MKRTPVLQRDALGGPSFRLRSAVAACTVVALASLGALGLAAPASAADATVATFDELRAAVAAATPGDPVSIHLAADITVTATLNVPANTSVSIDGDGYTLTRDASLATAVLRARGGAQLTVFDVIVDGNAEAVTGTQALVFASEAGATLVIGADDAHTELTNASRSSAGAALSLTGGASGTIIDATFIQNQTTTNGGAIVATTTTAYGPSSLSILGDTSFEGNSAGGSAGALYTTDMALTIEPSVVFRDNTAGANSAAAYINRTEAYAVAYGSPTADISGEYYTNSAGRNGAVAIVSSVLAGAAFDIHDAVFEGNSATGTIGGAVYIQASAAVTISDSVFTQNSAVESGGAVFVGSGNPSVLPVTIKNTTFERNSAGNDGGAVSGALGAIERTSYENVQFVGNTAGSLFMGPLPASLATIESQNVLAASTDQGTTTIFNNADVGVPTLPDPVFANKTTVIGIVPAITAGGFTGERVVTVLDAAGLVIGTTTVVDGGPFEVTTTRPLLHNEEISVQVSRLDVVLGVPIEIVEFFGGVAVFAVDTLPPAPPSVTLSGDGTVVSGEANAAAPGGTITVTDADGTVIGTGTIAGDGSYSVVLSPAATGPVTVTVTDSSRNASSSVTVQPGATPPAVSPLVNVADGTAVSGGVGAATPGATIYVSDSAGNVRGSAVVGADGSYDVTLSPLPAEGETLSLVAADPDSGNASFPPVLVVVGAAAPDAVAPADVTSNGTAVTGESGSATPGSTVTVVDEEGNRIGTGIVDADGSFRVDLDAGIVLADGDRILVSVTDPATGITSPSTEVVVDAAAPAAVDSSKTFASATTVTGAAGAAEPGSTVTVTDELGTVLGQAVVKSDGSFSLTLSPAQADGAELTVTSTDAAGNVSPETSVVVDAVAPAAVDASKVASDGTSVKGAAGAAEPGSTVTVADAHGNVIGSAVVGADGSFEVKLGLTQSDGANLTLRLTDAAGNVSDPTTVIVVNLGGTEASSLKNTGSELPVLPMVLGAIMLLIGGLAIRFGRTATSLSRGGFTS